VVTLTWMKHGRNYFRILQVTIMLWSQSKFCTFLDCTVIYVNKIVSNYAYLAVLC
jgi:hypothetical protein